MEAYFDNSATTRCYKEVADIVVKTMTEDFGNPSAMHLKGVEAEKYVRDSAQTLARLLKVNEKEIIFTSGGTESNNLALFGGAEANKRMGNHIITTAVEHAAVGQPVERLEQMGYEVTIVPVDERGVVRLDALEKALREDTILVSTMYVNNEVGAVMPVEEIARLVHEKSPKAFYHVDAIRHSANTGSAKKLGIDMLSVSSHVRSTDQRALDFCTSMTGAGSNSDPWRRTAGRNALRYRQCAGNCRPWCSCQDGIHRF